MLKVRNKGIDEASASKAIQFAAEKPWDIMGNLEYDYGIKFF